jgi:hypothetical protein
MSEALSLNVKDSESIGAIQTTLNRRLYKSAKTSAIDTGLLHSTSAVEGMVRASTVDRPLLPVGEKDQLEVGSVARDLNPQRAEGSLAAQLYDILVAAKVQTSKVSMHMDPPWRKRIFNQLDYLLSFENWDDDSVVPSFPSFAEFLKTVINYRGLPPPFLGVAGSGNIWAAWRGTNHELTCEFMPHNQVRFVWRQLVDGEEEASAWDGPVTKLRERLHQFDFVKALVHGQ